MNPCYSPRMEPAHAMADFVQFMAIFCATVLGFCVYALRYVPKRGA